MVLKYKNGAAHGRSNKISTLSHSSITSIFSCSSVFWTSNNSGLPILCLMNSYFAHFKCFCIIRILFALSSSSSSFSGPQTLLSFPIVTLFLSRLMHISALSPSSLCKVCLALYASCLTENSQPVSL